MPVGKVKANSGTKGPERCVRLSPQADALGSQGGAGGRRKDTRGSPLPS